ncbi:MAG: transcription elongation factor GreA [Lachnospiraceae bacterium]|nr:transcription elongation factor GreA [Lachnospiraceae bacterium]
MFDDLTKKDIENIEKEIEYRKTELRPKLIEAVKEARAQGDLSENFEYYAAKKEKNQNESRIRYLDRIVRTANIIEDDSKDDEIGINTNVTLYIPEDDAEEKYRIVTTIRGDSLQGLISIDSPMGKALLGHKTGDTVSIKVNDNYSYDVVVKEINKDSDESDDIIRKY